MKTKKAEQHNYKQKQEQKTQRKSNKTAKKDIWKNEGFYTLQIEVEDMHDWQIMGENYSQPC